MDWSYGKPGEFLFHYTRASTAFEHILPDKRIRLSPYRSMRDPLEAQHWPDPPAYFVDPEKEGQDQLELARLGVVIEAKAAARLVSLTVDAADYDDNTDPFGRGYARASMWQFYGDDHRGVCLAFDRVSFLETLMRELGDSSRIIAAPVKYVKSLTLDALPSQPPADLTSDGFYAAVDDYLAKNAERLLFTKLLDWSGEQEFRFVAVRHGTDEERGPLDVSFGDSLRAVIVGAELPGWQRAGGEVICREAGDVELVRCIWNQRRPMIVRDVKGFGER